MHLYSMHTDVGNVSLRKRSKFSYGLQHTSTYIVGMYVYMYMSSVFANE